MRIPSKNQIIIDLSYIERLCQNPTQHEMAQAPLESGFNVYSYFGNTWIFFGFSKKHFDDDTYSDDSDDSDEKS